MPRTTFVKVDGLREVKAALRELPKATGKNVLRRVLIRRAEPVAERARQLAPVDTGQLRDSIVVSTKLGKRQRRGHSKQDRDDVDVFVGPGPAGFYGWMQEFGTARVAARPFMRPAWDAEKAGVLSGIADDLRKEIEKAAARLARKAARAAK